ncbi:uncharacterized protein [Chironomus tepperi]|uniref:uncharacterized protein n=1 Tax=Chironomus tepperi TaxID=113505 RepID=UPI00391F4BB3
MEVKNRRRQESPFKCLKPLIRIWGLATAIVICGIGMDILMHGYEAGIYLLLSAALIFLFEIKWVITLFLQLICTSKDRNSLCLHCWKWTGVFGSWRLSFPYVALGVALIMWPHNLWLSYVGGIQLIMLAILRMFTVFRTNIRGREDSLLPEFDESTDKYDILSDGLDDVTTDNNNTTILHKAQPTLEDEEALDPIDNEDNDDDI